MVADSVVDLVRVSSYDAIGSEPPLAAYPSIGVTVEAPPDGGSAAPRIDAHAHSAPYGLHRFHQGHWVRRLVDTLVGAARALLR